MYSTMIMLSLLLLSLSFLSVLILHHISPPSSSSSLRRNGKALPRPPNTLPIIGNGLLFLQDRHKLFSWFTRCIQIFGLETFEISVPSLPPGVVVNDPTNVEFIFKNQGIFEKGAFFKERSWDLFGNGIINADGHDWRVQRKAGLHFMSNSNLQVLTDRVLPKYLKETMDVLDAAASSRERLDLEAVFLELTTQLMGRMAYAMEMHTSDSFSLAFDVASGKIGERFQNPLWQITESLFGRSFRKCIATVKRFGREIVVTAVESRKAQAAAKECVKVNTFTENGVKDPNEGSEVEMVEGSLINSLLDSIDDHQMVADAALNYLSAGRDTTAQSLTWTFYLLMKHGNVLSRLRTEIAALKVGARGIEEHMKGYSPNSLPTTMATIYESLRLYPPVPFELKQCMKADGVTLPDGTYLPFRSIVLWCTWAMNRSPDIWKPAPTLPPHLRPEDFEPMRWLQPSAGISKFAPRSAHEFPVFNGGTRTCLGKKMAEAVMCRVVACLVERYEFRMADETEEKMSRNSLTLPMRGGLEVYVMRR